MFFKIVASAWYRRLFATRLSPQRQAMSEFEATAQGCWLATSLGGVLTGRGADIIIIDDPLKPEEALSQTQRQAANDWFDHTLYSRLNDTRTGAIIVIMHRLHEDDLAGHVMAHEDWDVVRFPAIAEGDEIWALDNELGQFVFTRQHGEALHPERQPLAILDLISRTIGEYNFVGQYQQAPSPQGGGMVKAAWFRNYAQRAPRQVRSDRAELGHRQQGLRAQRFQRLHELGHQRQGPLSTARVAPAHRISRTEARSARTIRAVPALCRADRGQGLGDPADPAADPRGPLRGDR